MFRSTRTGTAFVAASNSDERSRTEPDYLCDGTADDVEIQAAVDSLPSTGGMVILSEGTFTLSATVTRSNDNITIMGMGMGTRLVNDAATVLISDGGQNGWAFLEFDVDAGDITASGTGIVTDYWLNGVRQSIDVSLTAEEVMDIAGPLVATGGTKTGIAITYDDANDNMDFVVDHDTADNFAQGEHFTMLDEDDLTSDSDTQAATQQSVKAYVDSLSTTSGILSPTYFVDASASDDTGQSITTAGGSTTILYQTLQSAITAGAALGGDISIYVTPGTFSENVIIPSDYGSGENLRISGAGREQTSIGGTASGNIAMTFIGTGILHLDNLTLRGNSSGQSFLSNGINKTCFFEEITFEDDVRADLTGGWFRSCKFESSYDCESSFNGNVVFLINCEFDGTFNWTGQEMTRVFFSSCRWNTGAQILVTGGCDLNGVGFSNCEMFNTTTWMHVNSASSNVNALMLSNCLFTNNVTNGNIYIQDLQNTTDVSKRGLIVTGCSFKGGSNPFIKCDASEAQELSLVGNNVNSDSPVVVGQFNRSTFGPNWPPNFDINISAGAGNMYVGSNISLTGKTGTQTMMPFDDGTSDPIPTDSTVAADGTEESPARKDHRHFATAATSSVSGISEHATQAEMDTAAAGALVGLPSQIADSVRRNVWSFAVSSGTDTVTLGLTPTYTGDNNGELIYFEAGDLNTGAVTLNIDGNGAKAIVKHNDVALAAGDIEAGQMVCVVYESSADNYQMISGLGNAPASGYTDAQAILAVEGEATLVLEGLQLKIFTEDIASDEITSPRGSFILATTETGFTDDLDGIGLGADGKLIVVKAIPGDTITIRHSDAGASTGNKILLNNNADLILVGNDDDTVTLIYEEALEGSNGAWVETARADGSTNSTGSGFTKYTYVVDANGTDDLVVTLSNGTSSYIEQTTVQKAIEAGDILGTDYSIYVTAGEYQETITFDSSTPNQNITIEGAGDYETIIGPQGASGNDGLRVEDSGCTVIIKNLRLQADSDGSAVYSTGSATCDFENVRFDEKVETNTEYGSYINCYFQQGYNTGTSLTPFNIQFTSCRFSGNSVWANNIDKHYFVNCQWDTNAQIIITDNANQIYFIGCHMGSGHLAPGEIKLHFDDSAGTFTFTFIGCDFPSPDTTTGMIYIEACAGSPQQNVLTVKDSYFRQNASETNPQIFSGDTDTVLILEGNNFDAESADYPIVKGSFKNSIFGANYPPTYDIDVDAGSGNVYYGAKTTLTGEVGTVKVFDIVSHDTTATGTNLTELTDASETTLHSHAAGGGDVTGDSASIDGEIVTFDGTTGKIIESGMTTNSNYTQTLGAATLNLYDATNNGNPFIRIGSSATNNLIINPIYDTDAQTLNHVSFTTATASASGDAGEFKFVVDAIPIFQIDDGGIEVVGTVMMKEQAAANTDIAAYGQFWVETATPNRPKFTDDAGTDFELGQLRVANKQLTNAEILAFRATPIAVVPAPGAGLCNIVQKIYIVCDDAAGTYTNTSDDLIVEYADGTNISTGITADNLQGGGVNRIYTTPLVAEEVPDDNAAIQIFNVGDGEWGGGNVANTMSIRIWYTTVPTVAFS